MSNPRQVKCQKYSPTRNATTLRKPHATDTRRTWEAEGSSEAAGLGRAMAIATASAAEQQTVAKSWAIDESAQRNIIEIVEHADGEGKYIC